MQYISKIPIPNLSKPDKQPIISIVTQILAAKNSYPKADTTNLEAEINQLVYAQYDLTGEEIKIVESL